MPTLCNLQKSEELLKADKWHLNSDGTTLKQQKKMAFLINGLVLGVYDVADGTSRTAIECLKNELRKLEGFGFQDDELHRFVSCTGDGASTQVKLNRLIEEESGRGRGTIVENKCSMHLGVNLRSAQVKAMRDVHVEDDDSDDDNDKDRDDDDNNDDNRDDDQEALNNDDDDIDDDDEEDDDDRDDDADDDEVDEDDDDDDDGDDDQEDDDGDDNQEDDDDDDDDDDGDDDQEDDDGDDDEVDEDDDGNDDDDGDDDEENDDRDNNQEAHNNDDDDIDDDDEEDDDDRDDDDADDDEVDEDDDDDDDDGDDDQEDDDGDDDDDDDDRDDNQEDDDEVDEDDDDGDVENEVDNVCSKKPTVRSRNDVDQVVHEVCKLFGHLGTPEYCHGAEAFRVYLAKESKTGDSYYETAKNVYLKRQVGSRYYVTACNAGILLFLRKAMVSFLNEQKMLKKLNMLETTCLKKLSNVTLLTKVRLEGLLFDKVYADLMMLVKSEILRKSSLDMNIHYSELLGFLRSITDDPKILLDSSACVFVSELNLYENNIKLNHRLHKQYLPVREVLYDCATVDTNQALLFNMIHKVGNSMAEKLKAYKKDHLPGGKYFNPDRKTCAVLSSLAPHNDLTESVFGMNDWLTTILPNMAQSTKTVLIEFSYNKTINWLHKHEKAEKQNLIALAQRRGQAVFKEKQQEKERCLNQKIKRRAEAIELAKQKHSKSDKVIEMLKLESVISSIKELKDHVEEIRSLSIPESIKIAEIKKLIKKQAQIRSYVYHQPVTIIFSHHGVVKSDAQLLQELSKIIKQHPINSKIQDDCALPSNHQQLSVLFDKPSLLVGVKLKHRFIVDGKEQWFKGHIKSYRKRKFSILYDPEELSDFTLDEIKDDYFNGDLWIL